MYSLNIVGNYTTTATHFDAGDDGQSNDYSTTAAAGSAWNLALDVADLNKMQFVQDGYVAGSAPFNHSNWPVHIDATARQVHAWGAGDGGDMNSAAPPPASPACASPSACGAPLKVQLVPHGGTDLRIGEMPTSGF